MHSTILSLSVLEHIIIVFSISYLLTQSRVTYRLRNTGIEVLDHFFGCVMCTSFWISMIVGDMSNIIEIFQLACMTSVISYVLYLLIEVLERYSFGE